MLFDAALVELSMWNSVIKNTRSVIFGAALVELVDTPDSKSCEHYARDGSSPSGGTIYN